MPVPKSPIHTGLICVKNSISNISCLGPFNNVSGLYLIQYSLLLIGQQGLVHFFRYQPLLPIGWRIVQILRQCRRKTTNIEPEPSTLIFRPWWEPRHYISSAWCAVALAVGLTEQWMNITVSIRPPPLISPHTLLNDNDLKETFKKPVSFRPPSLPKIQRRHLKPYVSFLTRTMLILSNRKTGTYIWVSLWAAYLSLYVTWQAGVSCACLFTVSVRWCTCLPQTFLWILACRRCMLFTCSENSRGLRMCVVRLLLGWYCWGFKICANVPYVC